MLYMVGMTLLEAARRAEWDRWYAARQRRLLSIPGFRASQRFEAIHIAESPFVALHEVDSTEIFVGPHYRARGGPSKTGEWQAERGVWHWNRFRVGHTPPGLIAARPVDGDGKCGPGVSARRDGGSRARSQRGTARACGDAARDGGPARRHAGHPRAETDRCAPPRRRLTRAKEHVMKGIVERYPGVPSIAPRSARPKWCKLKNL